MPIKGTIKCADVINDFNRKWKQLINDPKEQGELYMITDLVCNDMTAIEQNCATIKEKGSFKSTRYFTSTFNRRNKPLQ